MIKDNVLKQIEDIEKEKEVIKQQYKEEIKIRNKEQRKLKKILKIIDNKQ